jgi:uncharacterized LabA/DUF88 family protein
MAERIAVFVDGSNAYFAQKDALGWWIDWPNFLSYFRRGRELVSARWYQSYRMAPGIEQEKFLHHLTLVGFAVRKKMLKKIVDRNTGEATLKGNLNMEVAIDALSEADLYDTAVFVTGDSDVIPLIEALRAKGRRVIVAATGQNVSMELRQSVGVNFLELEDIREHIESAAKVAEPQEKEFAEGAPNQDFEDDFEGGDEEKAEVNGNKAAYAEDFDDDEEYDDEFEDDFDEEYDDEFEDSPGLVPAPRARMTPQPPDPEDIDLPIEGEIVQARVQAVKKYGVFLDLHEYAKTLLHVKDMNRGFVPDAGEYYEVGEEVSAQIVSIDRTKTPPEVRVQVVAPEVEF